MGMILLLIGLLLAIAVGAAVLKMPGGGLRRAGAAVILILVVLSLLASSVTYVGADEVGIVGKNALGASLADGKIVAVNGEMGVQADVLAPGWHVGYWPIIYSVKTVPLTTIESDEVGLIDAQDGLPLENGQLFAPDFEPGEFQKMLDAKYFLTDGKGRKGKQASVLTPGKYRINTELFRIKMVKQTEVMQGEVAVLKSNYGKPPSIVVPGIAGAVDNPRAGEPERSGNRLMLAAPGEMGVQARALPPGKYPLNTDAFTVVEMFTTQMIAHYTAEKEAGVRSKPAAGGGETEEREIMVRTSDGFTFPVDVRIEYVIDADDAPIVVEKLGDDEGERFRNALNSAVRAIFRNNAETVKALDYVQQRSQQESQSLVMLTQQMARFGVTVTAVRIGNVGDEATLGLLLKTQTDREIAKQEQLTFQEQQKAAEQKKELARVTQESEEEKKLATSAYAVKIAEETRKQRITEAEAEAEAISIKAKAQADAYKLLAIEIGKSNAALIEMLKIVGEQGIQITPRVLMMGADAHTDSGSAALVGTILDTMLDKSGDEKTAPTSGPK